MTIDICKECDKLKYACFPVADTYSAVKFSRDYYTVLKIIEDTGLWEHFPPIQYEVDAREGGISARLGIMPDMLSVWFGDITPEKVEEFIPHINKNLQKDFYFKNMPDHRIDRKEQPFFFYLMREGEPEFMEPVKDVHGPGIPNGYGNLAYILDDDEPKTLRLDLKVPKLDESKDVIFEVIAGRIITVFTGEKAEWERNQRGLTI